MRCRSDLDAKEWDYLLAEMGGHPLQSALWGEAKKAVYGISDKRLAFYDEDQLAALIRVENKGLKYFFKVAWIPQGPALNAGARWSEVEVALYNELKKNRNLLCVTSPWKALFDQQKVGVRNTVWIDLSVGKEKLWTALHKQWRYGVRCAQRAGITISDSSSTEDMTNFYRLCIQMSKKKDFDFQYTLQFLKKLYESQDKISTEVKLFLIKCENKIAAGAFIIRLGRHIHYMSGMVDRAYSEYRVGEFIQWFVIEWGCEQNCTLYDLEGIDEIKNPSVAAFKKKMGGKIVNLQNTQIKNLNFFGKVLSEVFRRRLKCL